MLSVFRPKYNVFSVAISLSLLIFSAAGFFCAGASTREPGDWKFAVISDTQNDNRNKSGRSCINDEAVKAIAEDIVKENPDFVLVAGDLVNGWFRNFGIDYTGQYAGWKKAMGAVYRAGIRIYPVRGNHDSGPERLALPPLPSHLEPPPDTVIRLRKAFREAFCESYIPQNGPPEEKCLTYSFSHKNAFIVGLDQYSISQHKINQEWLNRQLAENKNPHVFIFGHEPAFETIHKDNLSYFHKDRDVFWDSIGKAGAKIYFCGHDHMYNRAVIPDDTGNPVRQIILGTGGGSLRDWPGKYREDMRVKGEYSNSDHHGYVLVAIEGLKITVAWKALVKTGQEKSWRILDEFSI